MEKHSPYYPLIFGVIFLLLGIYVEQPFLIIFLGFLPVAAGIWLIVSERKEKRKQREKHDDERESGDSFRAQKKPVYCDGCGKDLTSYGDNGINRVGNKVFCNVCNAKQFLAHKDGTSGSSVLVPEKKAEEKQPEQERKNSELVSVAGVLSQVRDKKAGETKICSDCKKEIEKENICCINGNFFCSDCYRKLKPPIREVLQISYEIGEIADSTLLLQITDVADRLIAGGFVFCKSCVGNESSADVYTDYADFKVSTERYLVQNTNCPQISAYLMRGSLKVWIVAVSGSTILRWFDTTDKAFSTTRVFAESLVEEVYGNECKVRDIENSDIDSAFFNNWC